MTHEAVATPPEIVVPLTTFVTDDAVHTMKAVWAVQRLRADNVPGPRQWAQAAV